MSTANKILAVTILLLVLAMVYMSCCLARLHKRYAVDVTRLELALSECSVERRDANAAIERQNKAIEAVRVDTVVVEKRINNVIDKYSFIRETVRLSIEKDDTYENKINNIDYVLRRFHGVELRPASRDEN